MREDDDDDDDDDDVVIFDFEPVFDLKTNQYDIIFF